MSKHEHGYEHHEHEYTVIVNGRSKKVEQSELSYDEVVALAFDPVPSGPNVVITVTWRHGNESGTLIAGESVEVKDGMKFDVTATDKS
jgi:Multiubiquitin